MLGIAPEDFAIILVGHFLERKGQSLLMGTMSRLLSQYPRLPLKVIMVGFKSEKNKTAFLNQLNDAAARLRWHRQEADAGEKAGQWFAAAFHLRRLIVAEEPDAVQLKERLRRCENR